MGRRNTPPLNLNGARWRGVVVHSGIYRNGRPYHPDTYALPRDKPTRWHNKNVRDMPTKHTKEWQKVMALVWRYQAEGFGVEYREYYSHGRKVADIDVTPPEN